MDSEAVEVFTAALDKFLVHHDYELRVGLQFGQKYAGQEVRCRIAVWYAVGEAFSFGISCQLGATEMQLDCLSVAQAQKINLPTN